MKKFTILTVAVAMIAGLSASAADDAAKKKGDKASREARRAELIKKYDKNNDGKIDEQERAAMREELKKNKKNAPAPGN